MIVITAALTLSHLSNLDPPNLLADIQLLEHGSTRRPEAHTRRLIAQLEHLGHTVIIDPAA